MKPIGDYDAIVSDKELFNQVVYTPLSEAMKILEERQRNPELIEKIKKLLKGDVPNVFKDNVMYAVQFRQIATPNNDMRHFISIARENNLQPVFFEYLNDKFTSNNDFKHSLGQLRVQNGVNKNNVFHTHNITIVDFAKYDGKLLKNVNTLWDEPLVTFHKKLFSVHDYEIRDLNFYDASLWLEKHGATSGEYYKNFFLIFICFGILFENFLLTDKDRAFSKNVILPAMDNVINLTGLKPLIVPIGPMDMENDTHWISYDPKIKNLIPTL